MAQLFPSRVLLLLSVQSLKDIETLPKKTPTMNLLQSPKAHQFNAPE